VTADGLVLLTAGLAIGAWVWSARARERVDAISREVCRELGLQRLDEAVALRRLRLVRTDDGVAIERLFGFEFSTTGADRRRAEICLRGLTPVWVRLDHPDGPLHIEIPARA
jgi:hypothetical protein